MDFSSEFWYYPCPKASYALKFNEDSDLEVCSLFRHICIIMKSTPTLHLAKSRSAPSLDFAYEMSLFGSYDKWY